MYRDRAIDVIRGIAIFSMVTAHFAANSLISKPTHVVPWFDGASAFVLLSGLVLGMVAQRRYSRDRKSPAISTTKRLRVLYVSQMFISVITICVSIAGFTPDEGVRPVSELSSWAEAVWVFGTMQYVAPGGSVIRLYFVLMILAALALPLLARGKHAAVLIASGVLYAGAFLLPSFTFLYVPTFSVERYTANWGTWQLLFIPAIVIGWLWREKNLADLLMRRWKLVTAAALIAGVVSTVFRRLPALAEANDFLSDKNMFGIARAATAYILVAALYVGLRAIRETRLFGYLAPLETIGQRSLDSYVIQAVGLLVVPIWFGTDMSPLLSTVVAVVVLAACWGWSLARKRLGIHKLHRGIERRRQPNHAAVLAASQ